MPHAVIPSILNSAPMKQDCQHFIMSCQHLVPIHTYFSYAYFLLSGSEVRGMMIGHNMHKSTVQPCLQYWMQ